LTVPQAGPLRGPWGVYQRRLKHLPGLGRQLSTLKKVQDVPRLRRGVLGELNTAVRLQTFGTKVLDLGRQVYLDGRKFTDLDIVTARGSVIEVRDWASQMSASDVRDKVSRMATLRDIGKEVDGVKIKQLYVYAPGGLSEAAREIASANGVEVLLSIQDLRKVQ